MKQWHVVVIGVFVSVCLVSLPAFAGKYDQQTHEAQSQLKALGYQPGPADGKMGQKTRHAIKRFQHDHGLPQTGTLDDQTMKKMKAAPQPAKAAPQSIKKATPQSMGTAPQPMKATPQTKGKTGENPPQNDGHQEKPRPQE